MPRPPGTLTPKREAFCQRYAVHLNAAEAAREAGYTPSSAKKTGYALLREAPIVARVEQLTAASTVRAETDADYVRRTTCEVVERCLERAPVMVGRTKVQQRDDEGRHVWQFDAQGAIAGLNLLAKLGGLLPKAAGVNVNTTGPVTVMVTHRVVDPVRQSPN
jgi:phage terminase small subunit